MPENFYKTTILRKKRILRDRTYDLVIIGQIFLPIIGEIGTKIKESAQVLTKLDLWFLSLTFSHLMIHPRFQIIIWRRNESFTIFHIQLKLVDHSIRK